MKYRKPDKIRRNGYTAELELDSGLKDKGNTDWQSAEYKEESKRQYNCRETNIRQILRQV